jgi:hypothetical protein
MIADVITTREDVLQRSVASLQSQTADIKDDVGAMETDKLPITVSNTVNTGLGGRNYSVNQTVSTASPIRVSTASPIRVSTASPITVSTASPTTLSNTSDKKNTVRVNIERDDSDEKPHKRSTSYDNNVSQEEKDFTPNGGKTLKRRKNKKYTLPHKNKKYIKTKKNNKKRNKKTKRK